MDDNTLSALRTQLVQLIINQGTIFSNWIKFVITVQGALAAGLGFALSDAKYRVFGLIMALLGIVTSLGFAAILVRQAQWLMWFAQRWDSLATTSEIFPARPGEIVRLNPGRVAMLVGGCLLFVAIAWIVVFVVVLLNAGLERDEFAQLAANSGPSWPTTRFPAPIGPKSCAMPPQDRVWLNDVGQTEQAWPEPSHPYQ